MTFDINRKKKERDIEENKRKEEEKRRESAEQRRREEERKREEAEERAREERRKREEERYSDTIDVGIHHCETSENVHKCVIF
jgi:hypothetical protein